MGGVGGHCGGDDARVARCRVDAYGARFVVVVDGSFFLGGVADAGVDLGAGES